MKKIVLTGISFLCGMIYSLNSYSQNIAAAPPPSNFKSVIAKVNGSTIHYVIGGKGGPLVLIHGFGQNWYMWNRLLPEFSKHFTVIAPDLPGVGESGKPATGYDKKTMAAAIHQLVKQAGYTKANVAGHDIGLMVAYSYAAQFPADVNKLALVDALIPGIGDEYKAYFGKAWWWGFFAWPTSGELIKGKARLFLTNFWPVVGHVKDAFTKQEKEEFIRAYAVNGATTGSFHWFAAFPQDAKDNLALSKRKLKLPVLALGGEYSTAPFLGKIVRQVADNVTEVKIAGAGHWLVQEQTSQVQKALLNFFETK